VSDVVSYGREDDVGSLVIDKPPLNLFDRELVAGLKEGVGKAAADAPRALLVRAEGKTSNGGQDLPVRGTRQGHLLR